MPEGDSIYVLARKLRPALVGRQVARAELRVPALATLDLAGAAITEIVTHGKHQLTRLRSRENEALTLHTHLKMTGSWTVVGPGKRLPTRLMDAVRVLLELDSGSTAYGLDLPVVEVLPTSREADAIGHLGPDPLREDWDAPEAVRRLESAPGRPVAAALLDQRNLAGLGNLWVNELCFLRGTSPWTPVGELDVPALVALSRRCLRHSALVPGAYQVTTGDTRDGRSHWVAGRAGKACLRCGTVVQVVDEVPGDAERRRTWWCPTCQPGPGPDPDRSGPVVAAVAWDRPLTAGSTRPRSPRGRSRRGR
ncbi:DNA-formamidopyrimidine glycosylase family protein [Microlunatus sagamiharensis]|uniref:DNA-formamidopyrimidine glycosylase family protein n=1 Tax=Microlunatus sagamiharensis TaxID=546874 RepID=UPI000B83C589|nr:DNA-formamidopyrimidine glycosylase family protein [Microlunatus sagamiharensis]